MKCIAAGLCILVIASAPVFAQTPPAASSPAYTPMRPTSDCIRVNQINEWAVVDTQTIVVRTGPKRYLVKLTASCPRLVIGYPNLWFRPNPSNNALGINRICGEVGESVRTRDQPPCPIQSVSFIDKPTFDHLTAIAKKHRNGVSPPTPVHP